MKINWTCSLSQERILRSLWHNLNPPHVAINLFHQLRTSISQLCTHMRACVWEEERERVWHDAYLTRIWNVPIRLSLPLQRLPHKCTNSVWTIKLMGLQNWVVALSRPPLRSCYFDAELWPPASIISPFLLPQTIIMLRMHITTWKHLAQRHPGWREHSFYLFKAWLSEWSPEMEHLICKGSRYR
jgi:hypothetical protein